MGKFDEYISSLDGQENLDLTGVVAELAKLHNEEVSGVASTSLAKIDQLNAQLAEKDAVVAERDTEISRVKAANWDLVNQLPGESIEAPPAEDGAIDQKRITLDDAFTQ